MIRRAERSDISYHSCSSVRRLAFLAVVLTFPFLLASCGGLMKVDPLVEAEKAIPLNEDSSDSKDDFKEFNS